MPLNSHEETTVEKRFSRKEVGNTKVGDGNFYTKMTDPWDERYIYLHVFVYMVNVGNIPYMEYTWMLWDMEDVFQNAEGFFCVLLCSIF